MDRLGEALGRLDRALDRIDRSLAATPDGDGAERQPDNLHDHGVQLAEITDDVHAKLDSIIDRLEAILDQ